MPQTSEPIVCCAPLGSSALSDDEAVATAAVFKALADPCRVKLANRLARAQAPVCECDLGGGLGVGQPTVSHHLARLVEAGLVTRTRSGRWAYFSWNPQAAKRLVDIVNVQGGDA